MTTIHSRLRICSVIGVLVTMLLMGNSCQPNLSDADIPYTAFGSILINLNLPQYQKLQTQGYDYYDDAGVRGLIIYKESASKYLAFERNCSYHPNDACATVNVHVSGLWMEDPCCGSAFQFSNGSPTSGVAWRPLRQYVTSLNNNQLTITDQIAE